MGKDEKINDTLSIVRRTHKSLTGILSSKPQEWVLSTGYLLQRTRASDFLATFLKEWEKPCRVRTAHHFTAPKEMVRGAHPTPTTG
jgi:hypothetical protein